MKFKDLWECHELYCAGHFFEAALQLIIMQLERKGY